MASSDYPCPPDMVDSTAMFIPMPLYPTRPGQSGLLSPAVESQCQQWLGLDDHTVEPMYADEPVDFVNPSQLGAEARNLESSPFGMGAEYTTATWATQANNWLPFQYENFQQPLVSLVNTDKREAWPAPNAHSQSEPHSRAKKSTKTITNSKSRTPSSVAEQSHRWAKIGAGSKPSPSSSNSYDDKVTTIDDDGLDEGEADEVGEHSESWRPAPRKNYRVKNREAAKRCRAKTKQYEEELAVKEREMTQERMYLDACVTALKNEVLALKNEILQHGDCDCELIQGYTAKAAGGISAGAAPTSPKEYQSI